ncbi:MAG: M48 family metallopeptidase [Clostridia bacterium]|nr:M48 family metallopeptidase [Clostridia bacterium]
MIKYTLIRSNRKTLGMQIKGTELIVRAPLRAPQKQIDAFVSENTAWIERNMKKAENQQDKAEQQGALTEKELGELAERAKKYIPQRVAYYAPKVGVTYGRITIRNQRTKWGSCSSKGNLNFNCLLMLTPPEVIDSVVVHELCHRREMNHSERFYTHVLSVFPEYKKWHGWLKKNGGVLLKRMTSVGPNEDDED